MSTWHEQFLERCAEVDGAAIGEGAFGAETAIWVGTREVAHFDDEHTLDVRLTRQVIRDRRGELTADDRVTLRRGTSDWIEAEVRDDADLEWAVALVADAIAANLPTVSPGPPPSGPDLERRRRFH
jgi:hypothetical protein